MLGIARSGSGIRSWRRSDDCLYGSRLISDGRLDLSFESLPLRQTQFFRIRRPPARRTAEPRIPSSREFAGHTRATQQEVFLFEKIMAERQGFEPWEPCGSHAFQACRFNHSRTSPDLRSRRDYSVST